MKFPIHSSYYGQAAYLSVIETEKNKNQQRREFLEYTRIADPLILLTELGNGSRKRDLALKLNLTLYFVEKQLSPEALAGLGPSINASITWTRLWETHYQPWRKSRRPRRMVRTTRPSRLVAAAYEKVTDG